MCDLCFTLSSLLLPSSKPYSQVLSIRKHKNLSKSTLEFGFCQTAKNSRLFSSCAVWSVYCCVLPISCPLITHKHMCVLCVYLHESVLSASCRDDGSQAEVFWSVKRAMSPSIMCEMPYKTHNKTHNNALFQQRVFTLHKSSNFTIKMRLRLKGKECKQTKSIFIQFFYFFFGSLDYATPLSFSRAHISWKKWS